MSHATAFPDFPAASLPSLPTAWEDTSWHNAACPSWHVGGGWYVYIDYPTAEQREFPTNSHFTVYHVDDDKQLYHGDDWEEVLKAVASI